VRKSGLPLLVTDLQSLIEKLKLGYKATTEGKFSEAHNHFLSILHAIPLLVVETKPDVNEVKELLGFCREYIVGIRMELKRRELQNNTAEDTNVKQAELAAYFTHCNLQLAHLTLSLRSAMVAAIKIKKLPNCWLFCS